MLTKYIQAAMRKASYEILPDDGTFYGHIRGLDGVWANGPTLEACREELEEVLQDWILLGLSKQMPLPAIDGIELKVKEVAMPRLGVLRTENPDLELPLASLF